MYYLHLLLLLLIATSACGLQVKQSSVSFSSQLVETNLIIKRDATANKENGIELTAVVIGPGAPSNVPIDDIIIVKDGKIEVITNFFQQLPTTTRDNDNNNNNNINNMGRTLRQPSNFILASLLCLFGLVSASKFRSIGVIAVAFGLLLGTSFAVLQFNRAWTLEVTATFPSSFNLSSLSISIDQGSVQSLDPLLGLTVSFLEIDLCSESRFLKKNQIVLEGLNVQKNGTICASKRVKVDSVVVPQGSSLKVTSLEDSASVFIKGSFAGSFSVNTNTNDRGLVRASPCSSTTIDPNNTSIFSINGHCGSSSPFISVNALMDSTLSLSEQSTISITLKVAKRWSNPSSWASGKVPVDGENVVIALNDIILLDGNTASLGNVEIRGSLVADPAKDFWVTAASIFVFGTLRVGWLSSPYSRLGGFTLTGEKQNYTSRAPLLAFSNNGMSRTIMGIPGSSIQMHAVPPKTYTRLNDHAAKNATVLTVDALDGWKVGDQIAISPTTFAITSSTDLRTIVAIDQEKRQVTIDQGLSYARWGKLQYVTDQGLSLTPGTFQTLRAHPEVADVLDERAVIVHLSRNVIIQAQNDTHWMNGHGVHVMWMGVNTKVELNGVEVRRAGQAGVLGRYAIHAHMQSYNMPTGNISEASDGTYLGDVKDVYVRNCAVHQSVNRAYTIHGTCGAKFRNNVAYDIVGHAFFFEDGSEIRNEFIGNVVLNVRRPEARNRIILSDERSSGLWFTNGNNHLRHNMVGDVRDGIGLWNSFSPKPMPTYENIVKPNSIGFTIHDDRYGPKRESWTLTAVSSNEWTVIGTKSGTQANAVSGTRYNTESIRFTITGSAAVGDRITFRTEAYGGGCLGQSRYVVLFPQFTPMLDYFNNTAFAGGQTGAMTDNAAVDELGSTFGSSTFISTSDSLPAEDIHNTIRRVHTKFERTTLWMNQGSGYGNRIYDPLYTGWILADNNGGDMSGATQIGRMQRMLFIGNSLNRLESKLYENPRHAFATYHYSLDFINLTLINYPTLPNPVQKTARALLDMPGPVESWDLYLGPLEMGSQRCSNWKQFNVAQYERTPPPNIEHIYANNSGGPEVQRRHWTLAGAVYDNEGLLAGRHGDYLTYDYPFFTYGLSNSRRVGRPTSKTLATNDKFYGLIIERTDLGEPAMEAQTYLRLDANFNEINDGIWKIEDGRKAEMLGNMRHAAVVKNGIYKYFNHDATSPNSRNLQVLIYNGEPQFNASVILGLPWAGSVPAKVSLWGGNGNIPSVSSRQQMQTTGLSFYQDTAANIVWYHHHTAGGRPSVLIQPR